MPFLLTSGAERELAVDERVKAQREDWVTIASVYKRRSYWKKRPHKLGTVVGFLFFLPWRIYDLSTKCLDCRRCCLCSGVYGQAAIIPRPANVALSAQRLSRDETPRLDLISGLTNNFCISPHLCGPKISS